MSSRDYTWKKNNADEVFKKLKHLQNELIGKIAADVAKQAARNAVDAGVYDTGHLAFDSWVITEVNEGHVLLQNTAPYAAYHEFGAPNRGLAARPYLQPAIQQVWKGAEALARAGWMEAGLE